MMDGGTVWYQGARFRLGRGQHCHAMWAADSPPGRPVEWWPETPAGWAAAWSRFTALEAPGAIVHLSQPAGRRRAVAAVSLLAAGVICGVAGTSVVAFGFFLSDAGTVIAGGQRLLGPGLVLGVLGWLAGTAGAVVAFRVPAADGPRWPQHWTWGSLLIPGAAALAAAGAACAFAPSWDRYTLRTAAGLSQTLTAGNSFANPGPVMAGDVAVMAGLVVIVLIAALWRPIRLGAMLLAGAVIPMVAEAISALIQVGQPTSAAQFGIPPAQAAQAGLTISAGVTPAFWIYCAFVLALVIICAWLLLPSRRPVPLALPA